MKSDLLFVSTIYPDVQARGSEERMFTLASCLAVVKDSIKECKEAGLFCSSSPSEEIGLLCSSAGARRDSVVAASARSSASLCRGVGDLAVEQDRWGEDDGIRRRKPVRYRSVVAGCRDLKSGRR
jgi:hypothetical protein